MAVSCSGCLWWMADAVPLDAFNNELTPPITVPTSGTCLRFPPAVVTNGYSAYARQPRTMSDHGCGEYTAQTSNNQANKPNAVDLVIGSYNNVPQ